jgi:hypothetical protein
VLNEQGRESLLHDEYSGIMVRKFLPLSLS